MRQVIGSLALLAIIVSVRSSSAETKAPGGIRLDGIVMQVTGDGLVEISLGSDDGVQRGMKFEVVRDAKYLGRIEILQTTPDTAVGRVVPEMKKGEIQKNDRVLTRLN